MANTSIENLPEAIGRELTQYSDQVAKQVKEETLKAMDSLVEKTKATAPVGKRKKHYRANITSRVLSENKRAITTQWYVKGSDYRLSHLLEHGHALRDGGRYEGTGFISKAESEVIERYEKAIEEVCKNGK